MARDELLKQALLHIRI